MKIFEWIKDYWIAVVMTILVAILIVVINVYFYPHISDCPSGMCNYT